MRRWRLLAGGCAAGGVCRAGHLLAEWCRHCGGRIERAAKAYVHSDSCQARCPAGRRVAEPGGAAPGEVGELARLRTRVAGRWQVWAIASGYVAVGGGGEDAPVLYGRTPGDLAWAIGAEAAR